MFKTNLKIAWQNITCHQSYAVINVIGLSLGFACSILIFTIVACHFSFENFNNNKNRIYRTVTDVHSDSTFYSRGTPSLLAIVTACVNFINLSTATASNKSKEIGIRKVLGSMRKQLFWRFIAETALVTLFAVVLAFGLAQPGLPLVNSLFKTQLSINLFSNTSLLIFIVTMVAIVIFFSGFYPGLILSGFKPIAALKEKISQNNVGGFSLRRSLVITQFAISQLFIIGTIIIANQMHFSEYTDLGFDKDGMVMLPVPVNVRAHLYYLLQ